MKKMILGFMVVVMCSILLASTEEITSSLIGKVVKITATRLDYFVNKYGVSDYKMSMTTSNIGVVVGYGDKILERDEKTIKVKSLEDGIIYDYFLNNLYCKIEILSNSEKEYFAKIKQIKQIKQNLLSEKVKEQDRLKIEVDKFIENAKINAKGNPFALFMGMPWKMNAVYFKIYFKYDLIPFPQGFASSNFPLGNINIETIAFAFKSQDKNLKFNKNNYSKFYFNQVLMTIEPAQFETLLDVFTKKYGNPFEVKEYDIQNRMGAKFNQKEVYWKNGDRKIILSCYTETVDKGRVAFFSIEDENQLQKEREKKAKEAADIL
jgi:hypothetical protein